MGAGEAGVGAGLLVRVADVGGYLARGSMVGAGAAGLAGREMRLAEAVQCVGLTGPVADLLVQGQGLLEAVAGLLVAALPQADVAGSGECFGLRLLVAVTGLAAQGQCLAEVTVRLPEVALAHADSPQVDQRGALHIAVISFPGEGQRLIMVASCLLVAAQPLLGGAESDQAV